MAKFKNKKTNKVVDENLMFYVERLRSNPNFVEVKEKTEKPKEEVKEIEVKE